MFSFDVHEMEDKLRDKIVVEFVRLGTTPARRFILAVKFLLYIIGLLLLVLIDHIMKVRISTDFVYFRPVRVPFEERLRREYVHFLYDIYQLLVLSTKVVKGGNVEKHVTEYEVRLMVTLSDWCSALCGVYYEFIPDER